MPQRVRRCGTLPLPKRAQPTAVAPVSGLAVVFGVNSPYHDACASFEKISL